MFKAWASRRVTAKSVALTSVIAILCAIGITFAAYAPATAAVATSPSYEPDHYSQGPLTLYDASGNVETSGSINDHPFASYFAGSGGSTPGSTPPQSTRATAYAYTPQDGVDPTLWNNDTLTAGTPFGVGASASYPGALRGSPNAIAVGKSTDFSLSDYLGEYATVSTANPNVYSIRLLTGDNAKYYSLDIQVAGNTWTQIYPTPATPTAVSTSVAAPASTPSSPAAHGTSVALSSVLSASDGSHPDGSVELYDGTADAGPASFTPATGAVSAAVSPADGTHSYKFVFTPTTPGVTGSSSSPLAFTVNPAPTAPTSSVAAITASPQSPAPHGSSTTLSSVVSASDGSHPAGSVELFDGLVDVGAAAFTTATGAVNDSLSPADGHHSYKFVFTPTVAGVTGSSSPVFSYIVNPRVAEATRTVVSAASTATVGSPTTVNVSVTSGTPTAEVPAGSGSVQFSVDGASYGASALLNSTGASLQYTAADMAAHVITASFTPSDPTAYTASSDGTGVIVTASSSPTSSVAPISTNVASPAAHGSTVTLSSIVATSNSSHPTGAVELFDGTVDVGAADFVAATGAITDTLSPSDGSHSYKFVFASSDVAISGSSSAVLAFTVTPPAVATVTVVSGPMTATVNTPSVVHADVLIGGTTKLAAGAGNVQFHVDGTASGAPLALTGTGVDFSYVAKDSAAHVVTASFVPTDATKYAPSSDSTGITITAVAAPAASVADITSNPLSPGTHGSSVTLSSVVAASDGTHPAGSVELFDGSADVGPAVFVAATGVVTDSVSPTDGVHSYKFVFTPTTSDVAGASSRTFSFTVDPAVTTPSSSTPSTSPSESASMTPTMPSTAKAPSYEPDRYSQGALVLYDAAGNVKTSGSINDHPFAAYFGAPGGAVGIAGPPQNTKATAYAYTPQDGVDPTLWNNDTLSSGTSFGAAFSAAYPGTLQNSSKAIAAATAKDFSLSDYLGEFPSTSTADPNVYSIRVETGDNSSYYSLDIHVTGDEWTEIYPTTGSAPISSTPTSSASAPGDSSTPPTGVSPTPSPSTPRTSTGTVPSPSSSSTSTQATVERVSVNGVAVAPGAALRPGDVVTVVASGFDAGDVVTIALHSTVTLLGTAIADSRGDVVATVTLPSVLAAGAQDLVLTGSSAIGDFPFTGAPLAPVSAAVATPSATSKATAVPSPKPSTAVKSLSPAATTGIRPAVVPSSDTSAGAQPQTIVDAPTLAATGADLSTPIRAAVLLIVIGLGMTLAGRRVVVRARAKHHRM